MIKPKDPREIAETILSRSVCCVQVGAAIADRSGRIISWGWNSVGNGWGLHAEDHAIRRANKRRLEGSTIYVASQRARNKKVIPSAPCEDCQLLINNWGLNVLYRDSNGLWRTSYDSVLRQ